MNNIYNQTIVISIILLLIGVSVSSAISIDTESTISNNEKCRECNEVSDADLIIVERLLDRVEVYSKLLLVLSKHHPELRELSEELLDLINSESLFYFPIICSVLLSIFQDMQEFWDSIKNVIPDDSIYYYLMWLGHSIAVYPILVLIVVFNCYPY